MVKLIQVALALLTVVFAANAQDITAHREVAQKLMDRINVADYPGIEALFNAEMAKELPLDKTKSVFEGVAQQYGKLQKLDQGQRLAGMAVVFPAHFAGGMLDLQLALDPEGKITGLFFKTHSGSTKPAPERHQTELSLPFRGHWLVVWGGDTRALNYHHDTPNQRFAFDLIGVGDDGKTHRGEGAKNEDYYAFGREVLAPADGKVIEAIEGVRDNAPGSMNPYSALGNCVVIQHREDEVSLLAHLKQGSSKVKAGDTVKRGQVLGLCGNSGNSSEPHIHYHLQHSPIIQDGLGIKCVFQKVVVTKNEKTETHTNYSPVKGEIISPD
jgi:hypothetical protein